MTLLGCRDLGGTGNRYDHSPRNTERRYFARYWRLTLALVLGAGLLLAVTEGGHKVVPGQTKAAPVALTVTPSPGAQNLPASTEIGAALPGGRINTVELTDAAGKSVTGTVRSDGATWVPAQPLTYQTTYQAKVTAVDAKGAATTAKTNFTTMPKPAGDPIATTLNVEGGKAYGVGMPVMLNFSDPIPNGSKGDVERRLSVKSDPPQAGVWHWYGDRQVSYRPKEHWQPGTKLTVNTPLGGLPVAGRYLDTHRTVEATIGHKTKFQITNATKQMQVFRDDKLVKSFPVSLGKPETPTSAGNTVIMTRESEATWIYGPNDVLNVQWVEGLTVDGEFIHAAPWSVGDQGETNVSHGCTNLSPENAEWVYKNSQIGDPVTVTGTEKHMIRDNGWTVWDLNWTDYVKGSALQQHQQPGGAPPPQADKVPPGK